MIRVVLIVVLACVATLAAFVDSERVAEKRGEPPILIAQLSDLHIDLARAPGTEDRLRKAVEMITARHPDAVIVSGDIGENFESSWKKARDILSALKAPVYYVPGNHDETAKTTDRYKSVFGESTYRFEIKGQPLVAIDAQLLGNWEHFDSQTPEAVRDEDKPKAEALLRTLDAYADPCRFNDRACNQWEKAAVKRDSIIIQHVPPDRAPNTSPDDKPYWILHEPWRSRELEVLRRLHVKHILAGHWHKGIVYDADGFSIHVAPATSWSPESPLGFAMHTVTPDGNIKTKFVYFDNQPFLQNQTAK